MQSFYDIFNTAAARKGGPDALEQLLPEPAKRAVFQNTADAKLLAVMTKCIFQAGFVWNVIEAKWDGFEEAFNRFDIEYNARLSNGDLDRLALDTRIIRNRPKIVAVRDNALMIQKISQTHGSLGRFLADWPADDLPGLYEYLNKNGSRLGGMTVQYFLRFSGFDTYIYSNDVIKALQLQGITTKLPTSKKARADVNNAFLTWQKESGRSLSAISKVLACSVP